MLMDKGANPLITDSIGATALHYTVSEKCSRCVVVVYRVAFLSVFCNGKFLQELFFEVLQYQLVAIVEQVSRRFFPNKEIVECHRVENFEVGGFFLIPTKFPSVTDQVNCIHKIYTNRDSLLNDKLRTQTKL